MRKVALAAILCYALLLLTGAAVRLTGSGLGCSDWPSCYAHRLTAQASFHPLVEFTNRLITVAVTVVSVLAWLMTLLRQPRRRDLCWLAGGLVIGVVLQIPLGGIVVLTKLNPYLVAVHFVITIVILADAVVFYHAAGIGPEHDEAHRVPTVSRDLVLLGRILVLALGVVTCIGTMVAGAGPHAGAPTTKQDPIQRIHIAFRDIASLHSDAALFLIGLSLASLFAFRRGAVQPEVQRRLRLLFELLVVQGALGYTQYALHDNPAVIEVHMVGVTCLWVAAVGFYLSLHEHPQRQAVGSAQAAAVPEGRPTAVPAS
ncbi:MAG TPA: COX15/CtaA family protein [Acidimicrobiales bacterium]|nr:COX15/CtaA family protein [Acidimicrobiales bacterium]